MAQIFSKLGSEPDANEYLKNIAEDLKKNPPEDKNGGHNNLMQDLAELCQEAYKYEFHDFRNTKYAVPKVALRQKLLDMANYVREGRYDN